MTVEERRGRCDRCGSRGSLFQLPTGQDFCFSCVESYVSWESEGGRAADPDLFAWLWESPSANPGRAVPMGDPAYELTGDMKARIDAMTREQMAAKWRFAPVGDPNGLYRGDMLECEVCGSTPDVSVVQIDRGYAYPSHAMRCNECADALDRWRGVMTPTGGLTP